MKHIAPASTIVTFGHDPRALHLVDAGQVQSPRAKPEDDAQWFAHLSRGFA